MHNLESEYILSRFKEPKLLSDSGENQVYMVHDTTTNRPYIQRVFPKDTNMDIYMQMQVLAPNNIPKIHHVIEGEARNYIIEEYISGTRLDELIGNRGKFDAEQVVRLVLSLCDTLKQLHNANPPIIHRDIKPSNIIITDDGTPKLIDFNISRNYKSDGSTDTKALGTEYYAAPEQFGFAQTDKRTDIYAIGKLMITLLTGRQQKPEDGLAACGSLKPVIEKCCEIDPAKRYQDVSELRRALTQNKVKSLRRTIVTLVICAVIAACCFGYQYFNSVPNDVPTSGTQDTTSVSDVGDELTHKEPTTTPTSTAETEPIPETATAQASAPTPESNIAATKEPLEEALMTPEPTQAPTVIPTTDNLPESTKTTSPSWAYLPKPIFNLQATIEGADDVADTLDKIFLTDTVKYLLDDKYDYFSGCMTSVEEYRYSALSDGYLFFYQETTNNNASNAYLEINDYGEVYIGLYYNGSTYYYTNNPDKSSELHFDYLYYWFNFHGDSPVVFANMASTAKGIGSSYAFEESGQELSVTQLNGGIEYAIGSIDDKIRGTAAPKADYFEAYIEDYGYLYFHFYDDCVFVFDKLLKSAAGNGVDYVGKYIRQ